MRPQEIVPGLRINSVPDLLPGATLSFTAMGNIRQWEIAAILIRIETTFDKRKTYLN